MGQFTDLLDDDGFDTEADAEDPCSGDWADGLACKAEFKSTPVGQGATIGANATIVCGHSLGAYCLIGAGAVVTKDVPDYALMVGTPARRMGWMSRAGERLDASLICKATGEKYAESTGSRLVLMN